MKSSAIGPVVSSEHLARGSFPEVSEFEYGLIVASNAFHRWVVRAMTAAGQPGLSATEVLVLHTVRHKGRPKRLADICLTLDIEDTHVVNYAARKLTRAGLVAEGRQGKEKTLTATSAGRDLCEAYRKVREDLLLKALGGLGLDPAEVSRIAGILRLMSGQYGQAARAATVL